MSKNRARDLPGEEAVAVAAKQTTPLSSAVPVWDPSRSAVGFQPPKSAETRAALVDNNVVSVQVLGDQAVLDDAMLRKAFSIAVQEMVSEQDCCFIAKGLCHLCGVSENHFVPVVNFCPDANAGHSLCREHLRSIYRVRTEDLFAGKNRPTAGRRSLKCMVCSRTCPCSMCVLEKDHEIHRYRRWLREEQQGQAYSNNRPTSPQPEVEYFPPPPLPRHEMVPTLNHRRMDHPAPPVYEDDSSRPPFVPPLPYLSQDKSEHYAGSPVPPLLSEPKGSISMSSRKRAAKETIPSLDIPITRDVVRHDDRPSINRSNQVGEQKATPSPSAAHVMNCAESEKSLVQLLSSLNQSSDSSPDDKGESSEVAHAASVVRPAGKNGDIGVEQAEPSRPSTGTLAPPTGLTVDTRLADSTQARNNARSAKRKRDRKGSSDDHDEADKHHRDDDDDSDYQVVESPGGTLSTSRSRRRIPRPRDDYDELDDAPLRPRTTDSDGHAIKNARGNKSAKTAKSGRSKTADDSTDSGSRYFSKSSPASSASSGTRKRKSSSSPEADTSSTPNATRKPSRSQKSPPKKINRTTTKTSVQAKAPVDTADDDGDDDDELDTNLDYCEVCLTAGDLVCCDVCPRSFHLACLNMTEDDLPEGDWQCKECKKPSYFDAFAKNVELQSNVLTKCVQIIKDLKSHPFARPFLSPVEDVPHYEDIVQQPMDLSTIASKLKKNAYAAGKRSSPGSAGGLKGQMNSDAFANDVRLIWANCKLFNDDGSGITRAADELAAGFERLLELVKKPTKVTHKLTVSNGEDVSKAKENHGVANDAQSLPGRVAAEAVDSDASGNTAAESSKTIDEIDAVRGARDDAAVTVVDAASQSASDGPGVAANE